MDSAELLRHYIERASRLAQTAPETGSVMLAKHNLAVLKVAVALDAKAERGSTHESEEARIETLDRLRKSNERIFEGRFPSASTLAFRDAVTHAIGMAQDHYKTNRRACHQPRPQQQ